MKNVVFILLSFLWIWSYGYFAQGWHLLLGTLFGVILYGAFDLIDLIEKYEDL